MMDKPEPVRFREAEFLGVVMDEETGEPLHALIRFMDETEPTEVAVGRIFSSPKRGPRWEFESCMLFLNENILSCETLKLMGQPATPLEEAGLYLAKDVLELHVPTILPNDDGEHYCEFHEANIWPCQEAELVLAFIEELKRV